MTEADRRQYLGPLVPNEIVGAVPPVAAGSAGQAATAPTMQVASSWLLCQYPAKE